mmetsp:Transcript_21233/g.49826  ORF Transcript_21233/g.49826 Transcript_21233/m.49826 type:complete len:429 (-) Transcript_21233:185-1471(-)
MNRPRRQELGEVTYVVELRVMVDLSSGEVDLHGCVANVVDVVGPTSLVQNEVPVHPRDCTRVEVANDVVRIAFTEVPVALRKLRSWCPAIRLPGSLGGEHLGLRKLGLELLQLVEAIASIPMVCDAREVFGGSLVLKQRATVDENVVFVVIEPEHLHFGMIRLQDWTQVLTDKGCLFFSCQETGFPGCIILGLVLNGDCPNGDAICLVRGHPLRDVSRPNVVHVRFQARCTGMVHPRTRIEHQILHPCRWAPGGGQHLHLAPFGPHHFLSGPDEGYQRLQVSGQCGVKCRQIHVSSNLVEGIAAHREVAAVNMRAAHHVAETLRAEVVLQKGALLRVGQLPEDQTTRFREGAPESFNDLFRHVGHFHFDALESEVRNEGARCFRRQSVTSVHRRLPYFDLRAVWCLHQAQGCAGQKIGIRRRGTCHLP